MSNEFPVPSYCVLGPMKAVAVGKETEDINHRVPSKIITTTRLIEESHDFKVLVLKNLKVKRALAAG